MKLLRSRKTVPYVYDPPNGADSRMIILPSDEDASKAKEQRGRPLDSTYYSWDKKLDFMRLHNINVSVVSLANPWLDFLEANEAPQWARTVNDDMNSMCARINAEQVSGQPLRLFAFGTLPLRASTAEVGKEIERLSTCKQMKGVIMGTTGLGTGLDDPALDPMWEALEAHNMLMFLHPHYGLPDEAFGGSDTIAKSGHVLPLALGFPLETTIAVTRMFLAGVFDRYPKLQILLAHSGGTLPFLAGRIQSCISHEREFMQNGGSKPGPKRDIWEVLKTNMYLDAVVYSQVGLKAAVEATQSPDRVLFGKFL